MFLRAKSSNTILSPKLKINITLLNIGGNFHDTMETYWSSKESNEKVILVVKLEKGCRFRHFTGHIFSKI